MLKRDPNPSRAPTWPGEPRPICHTWGPRLPMGAPTWLRSRHLLNRAPTGGPQLPHVRQMGPPLRHRGPPSASHGAPAYLWGSTPGSGITTCLIGPPSGGPHLPGVMCHVSMGAQGTTNYGPPSSMGAPTCLTGLPPQLADMDIIHMHCIKSK